MKSLLLVISMLVVGCSTQTIYYEKQTSVAGDYSIAKGNGNIQGLSFSNTQRSIEWTEDFNTGSDASINSENITINNNGTYKFTTTLRTQNTNRCELIITTYLDNGSGKTNLPSETASDYVSRDSDQNTGGVTLSTALELSSGDIIEFRGECDADGASTGLDDGTILLVERVA